MANSPSGESSIDRLVRILETFTPTRTVQTTAEIGRRAGLPSSTAHRVVGELAAAGLLERDENRRVRVGMRLWELATRSSSALRLRQAALPFMERVQSRVREHTQLAILEQDEALFLERLSGAESGANITRVAGRLPLHASSSGLVLLAFGGAALQERVLAGPLLALTRETLVDPAAVRRKLAEVRTLGHAIAPGYIEDVSTGIAVPLLDETGHVVAALSVVVPRGAESEFAVVELQRAARDIERSLGYRR
ncbi:MULTISPECIES: IclR family transcriptional regulator [unclassified Microbacterium]|uniref:IclR family transcriptional regulator n=1 Tax=unclassified Microbacterium TaxID=2609290 RepID=UPI00214B3B84|nr:MULTISPECIES: IclR family transcriptional regulator [unclassified Microbacterium]MCR2800256.1 IclR family transcriptional regulator [Microbacterium sp. zg.Y818]MCR2824353.1 IclR family transcriptional regulator [Microbacterium sp. zg.Y909]WIM22219.1 IclR family transcriptional regulator [Microbacterium sp. zg-Y818]